MKRFNINLTSETLTEEGEEELLNQEMYKALRLVNALQEGDTLVITRQADDNGI